MKTKISMSLENIKFSSIFLQSLIMLVLTVLLPNLIIIASLFNKFDLEINTNEYSKIINDNIEVINGSIHLNDMAKEELINNNIWVQFIDNSLNEIYSFNKPANIPELYTPIEFIHAYKNDIEESTVFIFQKELNGREYSYFIGVSCEYASKYNILFKPNEVKKLLSNIIIIIIIDILAIISFSYLYFSRRFSKPIKEIIEYIFRLSKGNYTIQNSDFKIYIHIFSCLDKLRDTLKRNEEKKYKIDKMREDWIIYISHDIKTPLSAIKGFSDLLSDEEYIFSEKEIKEYSRIIYDKAIYIDELVEDLNFTNKIKNNGIQLFLQPININIFLKEIINELLLDPQFHEKDIVFSCNKENINILIDIKLMKRAFTNFIINFLLYNSSEVVIRLDILEVDEEEVIITLSDNGEGISQDDLEFIFDKYYRGTNTTTNSKGSGLGMAIANEVIKLHDGECSLSSEKGCGTILNITLYKIKN